MAPWHRMILVGAYRDLLDLRSADPAGSDWQRRQAIEEAGKGIVSVRLARWLGRSLSPGDSVQASRAYKRLEAKGLVKRLSRSIYNLRPECLSGNKTSALQFTDAGMEAAAKLSV